MRGVPRIVLFVATAALLVPVASCGAGAVDSAPLSVELVPGPIPYAVEAVLHVADPASVASVAFTVRSRSGCRCRDVHVEYARSYLDRTGAIDAGDRTVRIAVFGLYADHANEVTIQVDSLSGAAGALHCTVQTGPAPEGLLPTLAVLEADEDLDLSYMLLQGFGPPAVVDVDGEVRWRAPQVGEPLFPRVQTSDGLVAGSLFSNAIYRIDWLGRFESSSLSDPRCVLSHHNIERGKTGLLNTVTFQDGSEVHPQSVLVEMTEEGSVTRLWDFDEIFRDRIECCGEDPAPLVRNGVDWFHMNSAVYDASDDGILASSRENFVVKVDYETGAIRWLLGNPDKRWYVDFPASLRPLALTVLGEPPVGQHALSVSPDGGHLMLFDNGMGNLVLEDAGDSRTFSRVVVYAVDEEALTAEEVLDLDFDRSLYAPFCSSAYWTETGDVLVVFMGPVNQPATRFLVVDVTGRVLFDAEIEAAQSGFAYSAEEIRLDDLRIE